jgi:DNA-binding NtrC family response regulator
MLDHVRVVALTEDGAAWSALAQESNRRGWQAFRAGTRAEAFELIARNQAAILICDSELKDEDWREVMTQAHSLGTHVTALLASPVSDEYLWREVVQHHGFDVVPKPFEGDRLAQTIWFAWADVNWR